ncbi:MAG: DUF177 domain-containing protein [Bacteroidota bacterium]|nr:DUF177 domain-containing protein [Bacteroidota bacterium]
MSGAYSIPISGLKEGHHAFNFEINKAFFDLFEESEIKEGELAASAEVDRGPSLIDIRVRISGRVSISCDRCLEIFDYTIECDNNLVVRFGSVKDDSDPEILTLPHDEYELNLKQYLYEYIHLALPIQRIHPDDENGKSTCNQLMLEKLKEHLIEEEVRNDPRWDELKKLITDN